MYTALSTTYTNLETSLDALLASITAHAPSPAAATALAAADAAASTALRALAAHHANAATLAALRAESAALDAQVKAALTGLAGARGALKRTALIRSSSNSSREVREATVGEVLAYAKFISKTSGPARRGDGTAAEVGDADGEKKESAADDDGGKEGLKDGEGEGAEEKAEAEWRKVLPPEVKGAFIPWPAHEVIKHGALGAIQGMVERGVDPGEVTRSAEEEEAEKAEREAREEKEREALEKAGREAEEARRAERQRRRDEAGRDGGERKVEDEFDPDEM